MLGCLGCPAPGDEDGSVFFIGSCRPKQMVIRPASLSILPKPAIVLQTIDRPRIRIMILEVADFLRHTK